MSPACAEPKEVGPCLAAFVRFFFDQTTGSCRQFIYGGCRGNANNFESLKLCQQACVSNDTTSLTSSTTSSPSEPQPMRDAIHLGYSDGICSRPKEVGPCRAALPRFYWDQAKEQCLPFTYGGCKGNANNFETLDACLASCPSMPRPDQRSILYDVVDVCLLDKVVGPCKASMERFFFNQDTLKCERFIYGGCRGNANNFQTERECRVACAGGGDGFLPMAIAMQPAHPAAAEARGRQQESSTTGQDVCSLPSETGPCYASITRFFYDSRSGRCEQFTYGGCHGNSNNFRSAQECEATCSNHLLVPLAAVTPAAPSSEAASPPPTPALENKDAKSVCSQAPDEGNCRAAFPMYFFNKQSGACEEFIYGGCQGNDNRFKTKEECEQFCRPLMQ